MPTAIETAFCEFCRITLVSSWVMAVEVLASAAAAATTSHGGARRMHVRTGPASLASPTPGPSVPDTVQVTTLTEAKGNPSFSVGREHPRN